jgi:signal transduction histidine kinase
VDDERALHSTTRRAAMVAHRAETAGDESLVPVDLGHDLRHSAGTILLLVNALHRMSEASSHNFAEGLDGIAECARMIATMAGAPSSGPSRVDLVAEQIAARERLVYPTKIVVRARPATVDAPEVDLVRVLVNLVENACDASGRDGMVEVVVSIEGDAVVVTVSDSGPGFTDRTARTGLGLSIVTGIVVRLGGEIAFTRSALGGSDVTMRLPGFSPPTGSHGASQSALPEREGVTLRERRDL